MSRIASSTLRVWVLIAAGAVLTPGALYAVQHEVRILLDLDDDTTTGCAVATVDGPSRGSSRSSSRRSRPRRPLRRAR